MLLLKYPSHSVKRKVKKCEMPQCGNRFKLTNPEFKKKYKHKAKG